MNLNDEASGSRAFLEKQRNEEMAMKEDKLETENRIGNGTGTGSGSARPPTASADGWSGNGRGNGISSAEDNKRNPDSQRTDPVKPETSFKRRKSSIQSQRRQSETRQNQEDDLRIRQPVRYGAINNSDSQAPSHPGTSAVLSRYKYYTKLSRHPDSILQMPDHVVPEDFFKSLIITVSGGQSSLITIFSLWNTMLGTSMLSMPWAIKQAGFANGIVFLILMATLMFYTSYRILTSVEGLETGEGHIEFPDVCRMYLGFWAELCGVVSSLLTLAGGMIVYWILMSNFLYNIVSFIYNHEVPSSHNSSILPANISAPTVYAICPNGHQNSSTFHIQLSSSKDDSLNDVVQESTYEKVWNLQNTVPFFLLIVLGPIINFKSPTFFTKFNALGTLSVTYMTCFIIVKASKWGINMDFINHQNQFYVPNFDSNFPALTGIAALAYFVHNCCLPIVRNQKHPENNTRDLAIAYCLVCLTYVFIGVMFYSSFPFSKLCIEDNFLNNISDQDILGFVARIGLFFQMLCVFPLLCYIFRLQVMHTLFGTVWPSLKHVLVLNIVLVALCIVFAVFLPHIGKIIGFVGAFCGLVYAITLPCLVYMMRSYYDGTLTTFKLIIHSFLILIGLADVIGQFFVLGAS